MRLKKDTESSFLGTSAFIFKNQAVFQPGDELQVSNAPAAQDEMSGSPKVGLGFQGLAEEKAPYLTADNEGFPAIILSQKILKRTQLPWQGLDIGSFAILLPRE